MEAVARRIRPGFASVEKGQQLPARFDHGPQTSHHRFYQALVHIVGKIPAKYDVELSVGEAQILVQKLFAVEDLIALFVFRYQLGVGGGFQQIFAVYFVSAGG